MNNEIEKSICYWVEMTYILNSISNLDEYTDEVSEHHDFEGWLNGKKSQKEKNINGLSNMFGKCVNYAYELQHVSEKQLELTLKEMIDTKKKPFDDGGKRDYISNIDSIINFLFDNFDKIYANNMQEQVTNFNNVLEQIIMELI